MIKSQLVRKIAEQKPHLYQHDIENVVEVILDEIGAAMARGDRVELSDFDAFFKTQRPARIRARAKSARLS